MSATFTSFESQIHKDDEVSPVQIFTLVVVVKYGVEHVLDDPSGIISNYIPQDQTKDGVALLVTDHTHANSTRLQYKPFCKPQLYIAVIFEPMTVVKNY